MTPLSSLPEIEFVSSDKETVLAELINLYTETTGRALAQGDPIRLFLYTIAEVIIQQRAWINYTGKQNLLRYATGGNLDHIGVLVGAERLATAAATTTVKITLSEERAVSTLIPSGTRITAGDNVFFALTENVNIIAGETTATASAQCTVTGSAGNGYLPGELKTIVDPVPFVASIVNTTTSEGGAEVEDDDSYREAIHEAPEKFSCAGPDGAYEYFAKRASALSADVSVTSPQPGKVQIVPLLEGGEIPGEEILDAVLEVCNDRTVRPLTDQVSAVAPTKVEFDITATYYIDREDEARAATIQQQVTEAVNAFVLWQKSKLGRDVNPSELIRRIMDAGAKRVVVTAPAYAVVSETQVAVAKTTNVSLGGWKLNKLDDVQLKTIAPPSINNDKNVQALCDAIDVKLREIAAASGLVLLLPRLDELPEEIVDELAWQYHVDFYDYSADIEKKRALVRQAIAWHKRKGTPAAVEEVCTAVFKSARVFENWEYGGEPYHFQVRLIEEGIPDETVIDNLHRAIAETKNTRSWLDGLSFYREIYGKLFLMNIVAQHKAVTIYPAAFPDQKASGAVYTGIGINYHKSVEVY